MLHNSEMIPVNVISCHENNPSLWWSNTIQSIQQTTEGKSSHAFVHCGIWRENRDDSSHLSVNKC